jgi:hypothetical protein
VEEVGEGDDGRAFFCEMSSLRAFTFTPSGVGERGSRGRHGVGEYLNFLRLLLVTEQNWKIAGRKKSVLP